MPRERVIDYVASEDAEWMRSPLLSDPGPLRDTIAEILGADSRIGDLKHPCVIPTVCLTKGGPQIFKTDHHPDFSRDHRIKAVDVAMATSAVPPIVAAC